MRTRRLPSAVNPLLAVVLLGMLGALSLLPRPASAANADACGVISQHTMARAFGLSNSFQQKAVLRKPGNSAGVIHARCRAFSWAGPKPNNAAERRSDLLAGKVADLRIETWVPDTGPAQANWFRNFSKKLDGLRTRAKQEFIGGDLRGASFRPPPFGADAGIGYQAVSGETKRLRAFWWDRARGTIVSFNIVEARQKPIVQSVRTLASQIVPAIG